MNRVAGIFIEAGCALGGSSIVLAGAKSIERRLFCYDVFGMIPKPGEEDGLEVYERYSVISSGKSEGLNGEIYYGYRDDLLTDVKMSFQKFGFPIDDNNINLIKGLYEDTLVVNEPVAFAHIDCDWYASVKLCLERIYPFLAKGAILVIDDYYYYSGCKKAVDEFLCQRKGEFSIFEKSRLHLIRR